MGNNLKFKICRTDYVNSLWNGKEWKEFGLELYPRTTSVIVVGINEGGEEVSLEEFIKKPLGTWVIPTREGLVYCRSIGAAIAVIEEEFDAMEDKDMELTALRLDEKEVGWERAFWVRRYTISRYCGSFSAEAERLKV